MSLHEVDPCPQPKAKNDTHFSRKAGKKKQYSRMFIAEFTAANRNALPFISRPAVARPLSRNMLTVVRSLSPSVFSKTRKISRIKRPIPPVWHPRNMDTMPTTLLRTGRLTKDVLAVWVISLWRWLALRTVTTKIDVQDNQEKARSHVSERKIYTQIHSFHKVRVVSHGPPF